MSGYFGIGIENGKTTVNLGTLWRSAHVLGASFLFTVRRRYDRQASDTMKSWRSVPLYNYESIDDLYKHVPYDCRLVGVELDERAEPLQKFKHPNRAVYLLGAEDNGLSEDTLNRCHMLVRIPGEKSLNVAAAGTVVMYDRICKEWQWLGGKQYAPVSPT